MQLTSSLSFEGIRESDDAFLSLFPHRYDYIYAKHPVAKESPLWHTESRHPLSDRLIRQGASLYGVRFGTKTSYCLIDIDTGSPYHPKHDPFAISRILAALETIGLVRYLACTSSYSGGIHLYFPFQTAQATRQIAIAVQTLVENAGFRPTLGQLELFPNVKPFITDGTPTLYAAHRLPMQAGSYLLNSAWEPVFSNAEIFAQQWQRVQQHNVLDSVAIEKLLQTARRQQYGFSGKADKFLNDLNAEIEMGWTGYGQTNHLLGRIALRSYIFGHVLYASHPLEGTALVADIVKVATGLPGYREWCRHQHEIEQRAEEWARCVEASRYFHFGSKRSAPFKVAELPTPTWNQQQSEAARDRIRRAIADLLNQGCLPARATERFKALVQRGIGGGSLYRHRDLWHPQHLMESPAEENSPVENPPHPPTIQSSEGYCAEGASPSDSTSLFTATDGNRFADGVFDVVEQETSDNAGNNSCNGANAGEATEPGVRFVQQILAEIQGRQQSRQHAATQSLLLAQQKRLQERQTLYQQRLQQYLASNDPILIAEARRCGAVSSPG